VHQKKAFHAKCGTFRSEKKKQPKSDNKKRKGMASRPKKEILQWFCCLGCLERTPYPAEG